ncbi:carbon-nitrogen hydrolase family protein [Roseibacterium beibuensis]|uniref:Carbon-nitrogen hydrolase family protein n=1 Tax=[Roseibacterium] beibuensis TaxID=1193142 RepID=A0ABP9LND0_9RHOB|nr:carbon-nitrogen hydrolase family protein [Roseibacterium beibuensis]MCS6627808.1 carbon-nitrogen hydrolase family protein [Roseibacterium beibuensis]
MKIAAAAYPLDAVSDWSAYEAKMRGWVEEAAAAGADLLVFPEYGRMELAALEGVAIAGDLEGSLGAASRWSDKADALTEALAVEFGVHILAPSGPVFDGGARPVNRAAFFGPEGRLGHQDKQVMTRFERETWDVVPGDPLRLFETTLGRIGILICYDAEFPLLGRALAEAGAEIILAPSCTDALAGYSRVRVGAMARALENQCVVVHAPTVGDAPWSPAVDENVGAAAIYGPPDLGFPTTGVIAEGPLNQPGWVMADVERAAIARVRTEGAVFNHAHWPESALRAQVSPCDADKP